MGLLSGIFFIGYFLLEIPGSILVEKWSARGWIARIMISWGIVAVLMGFMHTRDQFYLLRFLLGAAEAGLEATAGSGAVHNGTFPKMNRTGCCSTARRARSLPT